MSRIFEAIQKSESEQEGGAAGASGVTELLAQMEQRAATQRDTKAIAESPENRPSANPSLFDGSLTSKGAAFTRAGASGVPRSAVETEVPAACQVLQELVTEQSRLVFLNTPDHPAAEAYRLSALRLKDLQRTKAIKKLLITSANPGEGKSLTVGNLACALAEDGRQSVLVVEGDLRWPVLGELFGLENVAGATEWLQGEQTVMASIYKLEKSRFWIMPAGNSLDKIQEALQPGRLAALMAKVEMYFDWILVDSPPVMPLADTSVWMRLVDGILLVTRQGAARKRQLQFCIEALDRNKLLGAVVNCASSPLQFGKYYRRSSPAVH